MTAERLKIWLSRLMGWLRRLVHHWHHFVLCALTLALICGIRWYGQRHISARELADRQKLVTAAQAYLGCNEDDGSYLPILERYNAQDVLPRDYTVQESDSWCAVFVTVAALDSGLKNQIPGECSCGQLIELFRGLGQWVEDDRYLPRPGDFIFYDWDNTSDRDSTGWPDHVGIVVQTMGPVIQVIEGNKDDMVTYRYVFLDDVWIRGYGTPDYTR